MASLLAILLVASSPNLGPALVYSYPPNPEPIARTSRPTYRKTNDIDNQLSSSSSASSPSSSDDEFEQSDAGTTTNASRKRGTKDYRANAERWGARYIRGEADDVDSEDELEVQNAASTAAAASQQRQDRHYDNPSTSSQGPLPPLSSGKTRSHSLNSTNVRSLSSARRPRSPTAYRRYLPDYDDTTLASALLPHREMSDTKFELVIDALSFVGHPVWLGPSSPPAVLAADENILNNSFNNNNSNSNNTNTNSQDMATVTTTTPNADERGRSLTRNTLTQNKQRPLSTSRPPSSNMNPEVTSTTTNTSSSQGTLHNKNLDLAGSLNDLEQTLSPKSRTLDLVGPSSLSRKPSFLSQREESQPPSSNRNLQQQQQTTSQDRSGYDNGGDNSKENDFLKMNNGGNNNNINGRNTSTGEKSHSRPKAWGMLESFSLVLLVDTPPDQHLSRHLNVYYRDVVLTVTAALKHEELRQGWVTQECSKILSERDSSIDNGKPYLEFMDQITLNSSLCNSLRLIFESIKSAQTVTVNFNSNIELSILLHTEYFALARLDNNNSNYRRNSSSNLSLLSLDQVDPWMTLLPLEDINIILDEAKYAAGQDENDQLLIKFIETWSPRSSFKEMQKKLKISSSTTKDLVNRLLRWRKGKVAGVVSTKSVYTPCPHSRRNSRNRRRISELSQAFHNMFPDLPPLAVILSRLSIPHPLANIITSLTQPPQANLNQNSGPGSGSGLGSGNSSSVVGLDGIGTESGINRVKNRFLGAIVWLLRHDIIVQRNISFKIVLNAKALSALESTVSSLASSPGPYNQQQQQQQNQHPQSQHFNQIPSRFSSPIKTGTPYGEGSRSRKTSGVNSLSTRTSHDEAINPAELHHDLNIHQNQSQNNNQNKTNKKVATIPTTTASPASSSSQVKQQNSKSQQKTRQTSRTLRSTTSFEGLDHTTATTMTTAVAFPQPSTATASNIHESSSTLHLKRLHRKSNDSMRPVGLSMTSPQSSQYSSRRTSFHTTSLEDGNNIFQVDVNDLPQQKAHTQSHTQQTQSQNQDYSQHGLDEDDDANNDDYEAADSSEEVEDEDEYEDDLFAAYLRDYTDLGESSISYSQSRYKVIRDPSEPTKQERKFLDDISRSKDPSIVRKFNQILPFLDGKHAVDEVLYRANVSRRDLRMVIKEYSDFIFTFLY